MDNNDIKPILDNRDFADTKNAVGVLEKMRNRLAELELIQLDRDAGMLYLSGLLKSHAPNIEPLDTLAGLCSQIDNLMTGYKPGTVTPSAGVKFYSANPPTQSTEPGQSGPLAPGVHVVNFDNMQQAHFGPTVDGGDAKA